MRLAYQKGDAATKEAPDHEEDGQRKEQEGTNRTSGHMFGFWISWVLWDGKNVYVHVYIESNYDNMLLGATMMAETNMVFQQFLFSPASSAAWFSDDLGLKPCSFFMVGLKAWGFPGQPGAHAAGEWKL